MRLASKSLPANNELLDVVDARNTVVAQLTRAEIHARGLMHRSVHILVFDMKGQLFVQKRSHSKDTNPGLWDTSAAGHVDAGELPLDAAARELQEELGLQVPTPALEWVARLEPDADLGNEFIELYRITSDARMTLEAGEIDDGRWYEPASLRSHIHANPGQFTEVLCKILGMVGILQP